MQQPSGPLKVTPAGRDASKLALGSANTTVRLLPPRATGYVVALSWGVGPGVALVAATGICLFMASDACCIPKKVVVYLLLAKRIFLYLITNLTVLLSRFYQQSPSRHQNAQ